MRPSGRAADDAPALALVALALAAPPLPPRPRTRPSLVREQSARFATLQDAVDAIGDGAGTILIAPGRYRQCAVQEAGEIAYRRRRAGHRHLRRQGLRGQGRARPGRPRRRGSKGWSSRTSACPTRTAPASARAGDLSSARAAFRDSENGILAANDRRQPRSWSSAPPSPASAAALTTATARTASISAATARSSSPARASSAVAAAIMSRAARRADRDHRFRASTTAAGQAPTT